MALRYLTTFSVLLTTILAKETNDPSPLKNADLLLSPGLLPARSLLGRSNNPSEPFLFGVTGRLLRHANLEKRVCGGSALHSACPNDVMKCCPTGGDCCGDGICCESGHVCQKNHLDRTVCCPKGHDCSLKLPINPCAIATHTKCAGFDACCPPNNTCKLVGSGMSCVGPPTPTHSGGNVLAKRAESSSAIPVTGGPESGPTPCSSCSSSALPVTSVHQDQSSSALPHSSSTPDKPPSSTTPGKPPSSNTPDKPPSSTTPDKPPSSNTPDKPHSSNTPDKPHSSNTPDKPHSSNTPDKPPSSNTPDKPPSSSTPVKPPPSGTTPPAATTRPPSGNARQSTVTTAGSERIVTLEASITTRDGTVITLPPTVVVTGGSGDKSKSTAPITTVETSTMTSAVVSDGITSYVEIPIATTRVFNPDFAGTEATGTGTGSSSSSSSSGKSGPNTAVVAGASIGGIIILAALLFGVFLLVRKKRARGKEDPDMQGIFTPRPVREPTIPILPPAPPSSGAGGRGSTASPVSELSSRGVVAPVPRYGSMYVPPDVAELQEDAAVREGNGASEYYPTNVPYKLQDGEQQQMQQVYNGHPVHAQPGVHEVYGNPSPGSPPPPQQQYGHPQQQEYVAYPGGNGGEHIHREY